MVVLADAVSMADHAIAYLRCSLQDCLSHIPEERARFDEVGAFADFVAQGGNPPKRIAACGGPGNAVKAVLESRREHEERSRRSSLELIAQKRADAIQIKGKLSLLSTEAASTRKALQCLKAEQAAWQRLQRKPARKADKDEDTTSNDSHHRRSRSTASTEDFLTQSQEEGRARILGVFPRPPRLGKVRRAAHLASGSATEDSFERLTKVGSTLLARFKRDEEEKERLAQASTLRGVCYCTPKTTQFSRPSVYSAGPRRPATSLRCR